ncbi:peptidoglycan DD-metalloendopeptidase family protein [Curtobacterium sp. MCPF17_050]|uniref:M23 family metallopeptidase n=1 Tax=Curtobacterium sp. MCPF17_050 TaxID=2175664 RepID=UPI0011B742D5|nr:M23 family metallopeptidase [Curtobacterium sp. MCPF17_050]WIB15459.1 peptidoglycan DD-metalloendopeptidase family protein [Curtobacterium sp. MCPF17_050]
MTPPDADHPSSTPVVHLTRRAALAAERAARARQTEQVGNTVPAEQAVWDEQATGAAQSGRTERPHVAAPASERHADTRTRRVPRRQVALAPRRTAAVAAPTPRSPRRAARASSLTVTSAVAALVMFGASAMPAHAGTGPSVATSTLAPTVTTQDFAVTQVALASTSRDGFTVGGGVAAADAKPGASVTYGGAVRSPFPGPVRMSSGFGYRTAPCGACSSLHQGLDFNPGMGAPIGAVAAGTVRVSGVYFSYGETVIIDHVVDGRKVSTLYGHMIPGSSPLQVGDRVEPGQFIGSVGSSGVSTGAHLHLEVLMDGTLPIDPAAWIAAHTGQPL